MLPQEQDKSLNSMNDSEIPTTNPATYEDAISMWLIDNTQQVTKNMIGEMEKLLSKWLK